MPLPPRDAAAPPPFAPATGSSRRAVLAGLLARLALLGIAAALLAGIVAELRAPPIPVAALMREALFGQVRPPLALDERQRIFARLARDMERNQDAAVKRFPDHPWSQQDHRTRLMVYSVASVARTFKRDPSEVYWLWDEGVRAGWVSPARRRPLLTVVPVAPRRR